MNALWKICHMVSTPARFTWQHRHSKSFIYLVAEDNDTGDILGCVLGVDHKNIFNDPKTTAASSAWPSTPNPPCLASARR